MLIVHDDGNNLSSLVNNISIVLELTYVNKKYFNYIPKFNTEYLPNVNLDYPNKQGVNDINLNFSPFVELNTNV